MAEFYLPYHFVPVVPGARYGDLASEELRKAQNGAPDAAIESVRHDRYEPRTHSGEIECVVEAASPIFIGDTTNEETRVVAGYKLDDKPALPASSLRGLVSAIAEAASNSSLRILSKTVLGQPCYSFRKPMRQPLTAIGMLSREGEAWKLEPVCLPLLQYDRKTGRLSRDMAKWRKVFKDPVFRVFVGNEISIRRAEDDPVDGTKKAFALRTTSKAQVGIHVQRLTWDKLEEVGSRELNWKPPGNPQTAVAQRMDPEAPLQPFLVRVLGCFDKGRQIPKQKKHELFLPYQAGRFAKLSVPQEVIDRFQQLADQMTEQSKDDPSPRPYEPKDTRPNRKKGDRLVPQPKDLVFFDIDEQASKVTEIAYSSIWRGRVESTDGVAANPWTFFEKVETELTPFHGGRRKITLAERVFGLVEEEGGHELRNALRLKGRVRFSPGWAEGEVAEMPLAPLKELSSPKPPSPALYFRTPKGANTYIAKSDLKAGVHWPQGRKVYLHHPKAIDGSARPWENYEEFVAKRHVKVAPWARNSRWRFKIRFDNLDDRELGLLLYAVSPNDEFRHKIGMGKPLGLGSVRITIDKARTVDRQARYSAEGWGRSRFSGNLDWKPLRDAFRSAMRPEIRAALELLGDPTKLDREIEITYPRVLGQHGQEDLYQWFVSNDQQKDPKARAALQPVAQRIKPLPRLQPPRRQ